MLIYRKISEKILNFNPVKTIKKTIILPNGLPEEFYIEANKSSVQIFAITPNKEIVLVRQFRWSNEKINLELPGGGLLENENPMVAAERELLEETGYKGKISHLVSIPYSPYSTGIRHSYLCMEAEKVKELDLDPNEFLEVELVDLPDFKDKLREGIIRGLDASYMALDKLGLLSDNVIPHSV